MRAELLHRFSIHPRPVNPTLEPITLDPDAADAVTIVGEFVGTIA